MPTIEIDFDVFKALTASRRTEEVSENDVLRQLLRLPPRGAPGPKSDNPEPEDRVTKGVRLPVGTELRATYKGQIHMARVSGGALVLNSQRFNSPSAAAMSITVIRLMAGRSGNADCQDTADGRAEGTRRGL